MGFKKYHKSIDLVICGLESLRDGDVEKATAFFTSALSEGEGLTAAVHEMNRMNAEAAKPLIAKLLVEAGKHCDSNYEESDVEEADFDEELSDIEEADLEEDASIADGDSEGPTENDTDELRGEGNTTPKAKMPGSKATHDTQASVKAAMKAAAESVKAASEAGEELAAARIRRLRAKANLDALR